VLLHGSGTVSADEIEREVKGLAGAARDECAS
jgi:hypothetical protein